MIRFIISVLLYALAFMFVLPLIDGIAFHGGFGTAIGLGVLFSVMSIVVAFVTVFGAGALGIATGGKALILLIPAFIIGFWLFPAVVLMAVAAIAPSALAVSGWGAAILGGLVMLIPGLLNVRVKVTTRSSR